MPGISTASPTPLRRKASQTSLASLEQSFFDAAPPPRGARGVQYIDATGAEPPLFDQPFQRQRSSRLSREFFAEDGADTEEWQAPSRPRASTTSLSLSSPAVLKLPGERNDTATPRRVHTTDAVDARPSPPLVCPIPVPPPAAVASGAKPRIGTPVPEELAVSSSSAKTAAFLEKGATPALSFAQRYAGSENPYLRAAAIELKDTGAVTPQTSAQPPLASPLPPPPPLPSAVTRAPLHVRPTLTRPTSALTAPPPAAPQRTTTMTPSSSSASARLGTTYSYGVGATAAQQQPQHPQRSIFDPTPAPIRGVPVFTSTTARARQVGAATSSPLLSTPSRTPAAASLRQSMQDYGQARLQEEAVRWYHRCSAAEQEVLQLHAALERQAKLLTATHWSSRGTSAQTQETTTAAAGADAEEGKEGLPCTPSPSPSPDRPQSLHATAAAADARVAALTSRSPDSVSRAYAVALSEGTCCGSGEDEVEGKEEEDDGDDGASWQQGGTMRSLHKGLSAGGHTNTGGPTRAALTMGEMPCRVSTSCRPPVDAASTATTGPQPQHVSRSLAETTAPTTAPTRCPSPSVARVSVEQQTEPTSSLDAPLFSRDTTRDAPPAEWSPTPCPSAILSKQYVAAVEEVEELRVRVDVAERESADLRRMCAEQELRCDDLETQLLSKSEQLLLQEQQQQQEHEQHGSDAATPTVPSADLDAVVAQVRDALTCLSHGERVIRGEDDASVVEADSAFVKVDTGVGAASRASELTSLVVQLRGAVASLSERHAALQAELDVVRADRNELIGEQSEQVRQLQQQLLEKDTAHWRLLEELQHARAQLDGANNSHTDTALPPSPTAAGAPPSDTHPTAPMELPNGCVQAVIEAVPAADVTALQAELRETRAAAAAQMEAQRRVLTERLTSAETQLQEARLRAEDEYDRLSGTIEGLTRELSDTRDALRVKEVSLRIALRDSFSPPPLLPAVEAGAATVVQLGVMTLPPPSPSSCSPMPFMSGRQSASPPPSMPQQRPPRPLPPAPLDSHRGGIAGDEVGRAAVGEGAQKKGADVERKQARTGVLEPTGKRNKATAATAASLPFHDDGTLRTLPSFLFEDGPEQPHAAEDEDEESVGDAGVEAGGRTGALPLKPHRAGLNDAAEQRWWSTGLTAHDPGHATASTSSSSREKSSRGLTVSMGEVSHAASLQQRGPSGGSATVVGGPVSSSPARTHASSSPETSAAFGSRSEQVTTFPRTAVRSAAGPASAAPTSYSSELVQQAPMERQRWANERRSASTRLADASVDEELPLPLRSPLFGPASITGKSPSPECPVAQQQQQQQQHTPPPPPVRRGGEHGALLGLVSPEEPLSEAAHQDPRRLSASPPLPGSATRRVARGGVSGLPPPQTPEEKLRHFLDSLSAAYDNDDDDGDDLDSSGESGWGARLRPAPTQERLAAVRDSRRLDTTTTSSAGGTGHRSSRSATALPAAAVASTALSDGLTTPGRTPLSLYSASATPASAQATPLSAASPGPKVSPRSADAAARYTQASMRRHRELWQQHESLLQSLLSSP